MAVLSLLLLILLTTLSCTTLDHRRNGVSIEKVLKDIVISLKETAYDVTVINYDEDKFLDFNMKIFSKNGISINIATRETLTLDRLKQRRNRIRTSSHVIFFFKNVEGLVNFARYFVMADMTTQYIQYQQFIAYISVPSIEDLHRIRSIKYRHMVFFYFIIQDENSFQLLTTVWYTPEKCKDVQLVVVNTYMKTTNRWTSNKFKIEKFDNLHGCNFEILCSTVSNKTLTSLTYSRQLHATMFSDMAKNLNFTMVLHFGNQTDFDIKLGYFVSLHELSPQGYYNPISQPFLFRESLIAVPVGGEYDGYEKLLLPFDSDVWFWIVMTFFIAFLSILILAFTGPKARNFLIGKNIRAPALNILMIFSGASQVRMPRRNFARFLVMVFVIYSLIIRTAWQSKMFEFMQQEIRKPEVQSFEEMLEKNFTFYMDRTYNYYNQFSTFFLRRNIKVIDKMDDIVNKYSQKLNDPQFKGAVQVFHDHLKAQAINTEGKFLERIFKHRLFGEYFGIMFQGQSSFMSAKFDEKTQQLIAGGLINYYEKDYNEYLKPKRYEHLHPSGPKVLTMSDLQAGFIIWLCSILFAITAFIGELIWCKISFRLQFITWNTEESR